MAKAGKESDWLAKKKQRVAGVFDRAAATYDQIGPQFFAHFGRRLVELAEIPAGARVLDVACGRGAVLFPASQAIGPGGRVIGIDLSPLMVSETDRDIQRMKLTNVNVSQMDAEYLDFTDASFDYVLSGLGLLFFPRPERALAEMRRVLKPSGHIALSTWDRRGDDYWRWFEEDLYNSFMPPKLESPTNEEMQEASVQLDTFEALMKVMQEAGFEGVRVLEECIDLVYQSEQEWWDALWTNSMRMMLEEIETATGSDGLEKFKQAALNHVRTLRQPDGIHQWWPVLFTMARKPQD